MDKLEFLDGEESPIEPTRVEETDQVEGPAPVEAALEPEPVNEPAAPAAPAHPEPGFVPIGAMLDTRDKLKAAEAELARFRAQQQPQQVPDPIEDPEGAFAHQQAQTQQLMLNTKLDLSEDMARSAHGDDTVEAAKAWALQKFANSPSYQTEVLRQRNPYAFVVKEYQKEQTLSKLGSPEDIDGYLAWKTAQAQLQHAASAAPPQPAVPTRSIASATSAGGSQHVATGPGVAFGDTFGN